MVVIKTGARTCDPVLLASLMQASCQHPGAAWFRLYMRAWAVNPAMFNSPQQKRRAQELRESRGSCALFAQRIVNHAWTPMNKELEKYHQWARTGLGRATW